MESTTTAFDLYSALDVLGLEWPCTRDQLKAAFRRHAKQTHPDQGGDPSEFREVRDSYELLLKLLSQRSPPLLGDVSYSTISGEWDGPRSSDGHDPTADQFGAYRAAFDYFNERLFGGELPRCLLNFSRKSKRTRGFFAPFRWESVEGSTHEISLNPDLLKREPRLVLSTLVHEMVHLWQQEFGTPSRSGYHNREWADAMEAIGLMPSDTGLPGGKRTGQRVTHYVVPGGRFEVAFEAMPSEYLLPWTSGAASSGPEKPKSGRDKVRYRCPGCGTNVWGKPGLLVDCGVCLVPFRP